MFFVTDISILSRGVLVFETVIHIIVIGSFSVSLTCILGWLTESYFNVHGPHKLKIQEEGHFQPKA
jgi:hypothetical protein